MVSNTVIINAMIGMAILGSSIKILPVLFCKKPIKNQFINSFLKYVPFAVLTSMVIPEVFSSTSSAVSASIGVLLAIILSFFGQGLLVVSLSATAVVFIVERFMGL